MERLQLKEIDEEGSTSGYLGQPLGGPLKVCSTLPSTSTCRLASLKTELTGPLTASSLSQLVHVVPHRLLPTASSGIRVPLGKRYHPSARSSSQPPVGPSLMLPSRHDSSSSVEPDSCVGHASYGGGLGGGGGDGGGGLGGGGGGGAGLGGGEGDGMPSQQ